MTAIRHVLEDVAAERYVVPVEVVAGLGLALDQALQEYVVALGSQRFAGDLDIL